MKVKDRIMALELPPKTMWISSRSQIIEAHDGLSYSKFPSIRRTASIHFDQTGVRDDGDPAALSSVTPVKQPIAEQGGISTYHKE